MRSLGLITQISTIVLSAAVAWLYVVPTFQSIGQMQTDIAEYQQLRQKVERVNVDLAAHATTLDSLTTTDRERIATYMPRFIDEMQVMRELQFITDQSGVVLKNLAFSGEGSAAGNTADLPAEVARRIPIAYAFSVTAEGSYGQLKDLLSLLEQNAYPLEVHTLSIKPLEGGFLTAELTIMTYAEESGEITEGSETEET